MNLAEELKKVVADIAKDRGVSRREVMKELGKKVEAMKREERKQRRLEEYEIP